MLEDSLTIRPGQLTLLSTPNPLKERSDILKVTAVFVRNISIVRPLYSDFIGIPEST
jgi:hypothetical protein